MAELFINQFLNLLLAASIAFLAASLWRLKTSLTQTQTQADGDRATRAENNAGANINHSREFANLEVSYFELPAMSGEEVNSQLLSRLPFEPTLPGNFLIFRSNLLIIQDATAAAENSAKVENDKLLQEAPSLFSYPMMNVLSRSSRLTPSNDYAMEPTWH